jgi:sulfatase-like protein
VRFRPPDPPGSFRDAGLHLAGLSALAVAQPLFDLLSDNVEFFAVRGSTRWDVVLFAVGIVVLPPLVLLGVEVLAGLAHARAAALVHLVFVAALVGLLALQVVRGVDLPSLLLVVLAAALGAAAALLYRRARPARVLLSVLGATPVLFLVLFLFFSPVSRLLDSPPQPHLARAPSGAPVVMVVLDELPIVSLMRADGEIDAKRYPNFARLAEDATWYRNTTTVHEWTTGAVPAILTGERPGGLPLFLDHPDNLFTLLGGSYDLNVHESQTHLCPPELCDPDREPLAERVGSLLSDLSIVYGHLVLPEDLSDELPSISTAWRDFGGGDGPQALLQAGPAQSGGRPAAYTERDAEVQEFVDSLEPSERPTLSFLHVLLPHHPWEYLPDGKIYASDLGFQPGLVNEGWTGDPELAIQAQQRHLLQVGYTDLALGRILDKLHETGLYDRSLVVVVADHGVSFRPHGERRRVEEGNMEEIAFVPLFVKPPGQTDGAIVDDHARTTDILPTIADILGVEVPWKTDGRSLLAGGGDGPDVRVGTSSGDVVVGDDEELVERRAQVLAHQIDLFGEGDDEPGLFGIGPRPDLLGRPLDGLAGAVSGGPTFESYGESDYDPVAPFAPVRVYGRIVGAPAGQDIAVAVNGRVVAVTRSFEHDGDTLVSAVTPEDAYRAGANSVRVFVVQGSGDDTVLQELAQAS